MDTARISSQLPVDANSDHGPNDSRGSSYLINKKEKTNRLSYLKMDD